MASTTLPPASSVTPSWHTLKHFTASTTLIEKIGRCVNYAIFALAGVSLSAIYLKKTRLLPPMATYAAYLVVSLAARKIVCAAIGFIVYPATICYSAEELRKEEDRRWRRNSDIFQKITLYTSGIAYNATIIRCDQNPANNGKWSMHALGQCQPIEPLNDSCSSHNDALFKLIKKNIENKINTLLINGPHVGRSQGYPTPYQMGAGFEAGLQFLEKEVKATHIALQGFSLGSAMLLKAILVHPFDTNKFKYLVVSDCTFSRLSEIGVFFVRFLIESNARSLFYQTCLEYLFTKTKLRYLKILNPLFSHLSDIAFVFVACITRSLLFLAGVELDCVLGAKKLKQLNIEHIIIQHQGKQGRSDDDVIPDHISLAAALETSVNRTFLLSPNIRHEIGIYDFALHKRMARLPPEVEGQLDEKVNQFFAS